MISRTMRSLPKLRTSFVLVTAILTALWFLLVMLFDRALYSLMPDWLNDTITLYVPVAIFGCLLALGIRKGSPTLVSISLGFLVPVACLAALAASLRFAAPPEDPDPQSPNGAYIATVPVERSETPGATGLGIPYYHVTISDRNGRVVYRDAENDFLGGWGVHLAWDESNRLWLYSSDSSMVYRWELIEGRWNKQFCGGWSGGLTQCGTAPRTIFPY